MNYADLLKLTDVSQKHLISITQYDQSSLLQVMDVALKIKGNNYAELGPQLRDRLFWNVFLEASTRTQHSFRLAIESLGGKVHDFSAQGSSIEKGESILDTFQTLALLGADGFVFRTPSVYDILNVSHRFPQKILINAGNGSFEHPTQTILDLVTLFETFGTIDNLRIGIYGDLCHHRAAHSLVLALNQFNPSVFLVSPSGLKLPDLFKTQLRFSFEEIHLSTFEEKIDLLKKIDVLYICPFIDYLYENYLYSFQINTSIEELISLYKIDFKTVEKANNNDLRVLHPFPRGDILDSDLDGSIYNLYFLQAGNGICTRIAILLDLLKK
mgnify:CR=1 FL=1